jgi:hypothetical protein
MRKEASMTMTVEEILEQAQQLPPAERARLAEALITQTETPLARQLRAIRARIVAAQEPLLGWDELEREIADRRGGQA